MMHVNNTVYFRYAEQARIEWIESWGVRPDAGSAEGPVVANLSCEFRQALKYPGTVEIRTFAGQPGRTSIPTYFEMRRTDDIVAKGSANAPVVCSGEALLVWISNSNGKPTPLPDHVRRQLQEALGQ